MSFKAEILADSLSPQGHRLTTMKITFPRYILAEMNTHRIFSRNSASSRAIPFKKMVKMIEENPFIPMAWQKDHKGMQGSEYITDPLEIENCKALWLMSRDHTVEDSRRLNSVSNVTKQLCNRLLEPFMWHTVIVTATEWENFFKLRCPQYKRGDQVYRSWKDAGGVKSVSIVDRLLMNESQAEIHIQAIAELMWDAYNESKPKQLQAGEWHIPFGDKIDDSRLLYLVHHFYTERNNAEKLLPEFKIKIATARCARISYETLGDNSKIDYEADLKLYDILSKSGHWSPFEHVARAMSVDEFEAYRKSTPIYAEVGHHKVVADYVNDFGWCRNFRGFIQQRALIDG